MNRMPIWKPTAPLPEGRTLLVEASAGTGKTWQMASLVTRLVAEYDQPIHQILVITFTNAAAAELRDRVRRRLVEARDALDREDAPSEDPVLAHLWRCEDRGKRRGRLARALTDFDRAPISTIHGFCQRTLDQLAFESGQEPGLELLAEPAALRDEIVDDTLARLYAGVEDERQLGLLADMGFTRDGLANLVKEMTAAVAPWLVPQPAAGDEGDPIDLLAAWQREVDRFSAWLNEGEGAAAYRALVDELTRKKGKRLNGRKLKIGDLRKQVEQLRQWVADGAPPGQRQRDRKEAYFKNFCIARYEACWLDESDVDGRDGFRGRALYAGFEAFFALQDELVGRARAAFGRRARRWLHAELERRAVLTYDTMLSRLAERIEAPGEGANGPLARAIRERYRAALVDEFQDTDDAQWTVLRTVFAHPGWRLVIVGDPKQAIYGFRGADVHVYLQAAKAPGTDRFTMDLNWRSDRPYVEAMNRFWPEGRDAFCRDDVSYVEVGANKDRRLHDLPPVRTEDGGVRERRPLELRWLDGTAQRDPGAAITQKNDGEVLAARDCAREAALLLRGNAWIGKGDGEALRDPPIFLGAEAGDGFASGGHARDRRGGLTNPPASKCNDEAVRIPAQNGGMARGEAGRRPLHPGDIAVLVRTNRQAERVRRALAEWKIPSVSGGRGSVFLSPAAGWVAAFLDALAEPGRDAPARVLATTPLFGWTAAQLARSLDAAGAEPGDAISPEPEASSTPDWATWIGRIAGWASLWSTQGFVRVWERALDETGALSGLLASPDGERHATDLRHVVELCHAEERRARLAPRTLAAWLRERGTRAASNDQPAGDEEAQRLESDARAVQVVTVHKSKGLEYPVVLLPFAWGCWTPADKGQPLSYHDEAKGSRACLDVQPAEANDLRRQALVLAAQESVQEEARLLYVALTRAAHHSVAWLGPIGKELKDRPEASSIGRLSLRKAPADGDAEDTPPARLDTLAGASDATIGWAPVLPLESPSPVSWHDEGASACQARTWTPSRESLGSAWQVASYSSVVAGRSFDQDEPIRAEQERQQQTGLSEADRDEALTGASAPLAEPEALRESSLHDDAPLAGLAGGPDVGTWVHAVFEHLDFASGQPRGGGSLDELVRDEALRSGVRDERQYDLVKESIPRLLDTPLDGGVTGLPEGFQLRAIPDGDRLDELAFQLRLGRGNRYVRGSKGAKVDPRAVRVALEARGRDWSGAGWLQHLLGRVDEPRQGEESGRDRIFPAIAGIMTGFVDLTFRVAGGRYYIVDYKTNRIASAVERQKSRRLHYTQPWLAWAMAHGGYHLQSLIYTLALHRMLSDRLGPRYDYDSHVGGHLYLFLRGMEGANAERDAGLALGVYADRWPREVTIGLDLALDGATPDRVAAAVRGGEA